MNIGQDVLSVINALPDAVALVSSAGARLVGANDAFFRQLSVTESDIIDADLRGIPIFDQWIKHGLRRLFEEAARYGSSSEDFDFIYVTGEQMVKNITAAARRCSIDGDDIIIFTLKEVQSRKIIIAGNETASWNAYLSLGYEPYIEFRPESPLSPSPASLTHEDRTLYLKNVGRLLRVKVANSAAVAMYKGDGGSMEGETFNSFFKAEDDALRFLDMLSIVGQMKAETTVVTYSGNVNVEMNCDVSFDENGDIDALYCAQRNMERTKHYEAIIGGSNLETNFMLNQPFSGFAFLAPPAPVERPQAENLDAAIDAILNQMLIVRANQAMLDIYHTDKTKFMLKPMTALFSNPSMARQALKELFVIGTTSVKTFLSTANEQEDDVLDNVSIYYARFDEADRMTGVMVAASQYHVDYETRHSHK